MADGIKEIVLMDQFKDVAMSQSGGGENNGTIEDWLPKLVPHEAL